MHPLRTQMPRWANCLLLGLALWFGVFAASAAQAVKQGKIAVEQTVEVLEDPTARLSASEVHALPRGGANGFAPAIAAIGIVNAPLLVMFVICAGALMRMSALMFAERSMSDFDHYALAFPGMLVGAFAITAWSFQETRQRNAAQQSDRKK